MIITPRILSLNHSTGRKGHTVEGIVIHVTEGNAASVRSWFNASIAAVSAHYMVLTNGLVEQFVREEDTAWHAGRVSGATALMVKNRPNVNPNLYTIGIEHEGTGRAPLTVKQRITSVALIRAIQGRHGFTLDRDHVIGHHEVYAPKSCPGLIDVDELVALAALPCPSPEN